MSAYFDKSPDGLTTANLKDYFNSLIQTHSWSTVKIDRNGLPFFYRYTLDKQWEWLSIVKPPQVKRLPVHYFMVTFTLPSELRPLARSQPKALYQSMLSVAASILKDFARRKHGGEIGFTTVLHTHSRQRNLHPHLHIIVASGSYNKTRNQWHKGKRNYLFNAFALANTDTLPTKWVVDCRKVGYGLPALQYLSRYLYRGVLPDKDIIDTSHNSVTFKYKDGQTQATKTRALPTLQFLWLILQHVLPKGLQRVRDYGFLHGNAKRLRVRIQAILLHLFNWKMPELVATITAKAIRICPCCQHEMKCVGITRTA
ncbi:transposase [Moritella yayanosii]|nr:transposase [Moritella yayanosii]